MQEPDISLIVSWFCYDNLTLVNDLDAFALDRPKYVLNYGQFENMSREWGKS